MRLAVCALALVFAASARAQERLQGPTAGRDRAARGEGVLERAEALVKPLPLEPIPDDPPPHEGALFEMTYRIAPPDLIVVEVLEALPGRPITGERLVRPDGKISLGFYGDVHVAGLTMEQAKVKLLLHLRSFLTDESLGLILYNETGRSPRERPPLNPFPDLPPMADGLPPERPGPEPKGRDLLVFRIDGDETNPEGARGYTLRLALPPRAEAPKQGEKPQAPRNERQDGPPPRVPQRPDLPQDGAARKGAGPHYEYVSPIDSLAVFVDVSSYNSQIYYVQGDVANPGRLPCTGNDTVFDAIQFSGGFLPSADKENIHLYRPERGGKPAKDYRIDYRAIERGDRTKNLQVLPGDRLVIERKAGLQPR